MTEQRDPDGWSPRGDRILALLPADRPAAFDRLPFDEQQWRGRMYLMTWTLTGSAPYSWNAALKVEPGDDEAKAFVEEVPDDEIAFRVSEAAQGRWYGKPDGTLPEAPGAPVPPA